MKYITLILVFFSALGFAQTDLEEQQSQDSFVSTDSSMGLMTFDVKGIYQLADKKCSINDGHNFLSVKYANGEADFNQNIRKRISQSLNKDAYAADGNFYIDLIVNTSGDVSAITVGPNIKNTRYFYDDLKSATKKVKGKWIPATCDGQAVDSKVRIKLLFDSTVIDNQ